MYKIRGTTLGLIPGLDSSMVTGKDIADTVVAEAESSSLQGLLVAGIAGVLFSVYPIIADVAMKEPLDGKSTPLSPYGFFGWFTIGTTISASIMVPLFARYPLAGPSVPISNYSIMPLSSHLLGMVGGGMWSAGTLLSFVAGKKAGLTVSISIARCCPLVASIWGTWLTPTRTHNLILTTLQ